MRSLWLILCAAILPCTFGVAGCAKSQPDTAGDTTAAADDHGHDHGHAHGDEHAHGHEGPHGGHIIELGDERYHAELTHDDQEHRVGIHVLDGTAKNAVPIEADSVTITLVADGKSTQYVLPADPHRNETEGKSSYFELASEPLCQAICGESEAENVHARVSLQIEGKPYVGIIETAAHDHDHDHDHGDDHSH